MNNRLGTALNLVVNVSVLALAGFIVVRPGGVLREWIDRLRATREQRRQIDRAWADLVRVGARLDSGRGPVRLVEFSDYQCPFCERQHTILSMTLDSNASIGIVYRHFPLDIHPAATGAARASICAEEQGRFAAMHARLFETSRWHQDQDWLREARATGIPDLVRFNECLASERAAARLAADVGLGHRVGVSGTPAFVHAGGLWRGMLTDTALFHLLKDR